MKERETWANREKRRLQQVASRRRPTTQLRRQGTRTAALSLTRAEARGRCLIANKRSPPPACTGARGPTWACVGRRRLVRNGRGGRRRRGPSGAAPHAPAAAHRRIGRHGGRGERPEPEALASSRRFPSMHPTQTVKLRGEARPGGRQPRAERLLISDRTSHIFFADVDRL